MQTFGHDESHVMKEGSQNCLAEMLSLTPRALCEQHWHFSTGDIPVTALNPGVLYCTELLSLLPSLSPLFPLTGWWWLGSVPHHHLEQKRQSDCSSIHPLETCGVASAMS